MPYRYNFKQYYSVRKLTNIIDYICKKIRYIIINKFFFLHLYVLTKGIFAIFLKKIYNFTIRLKLHFNLQIDFSFWFIVSYNHVIDSLNLFVKKKRFLFFWSYYIIRLTYNYCDLKRTEFIYLMNKKHTIIIINNYLSSIIKTNNTSFVYI